MGWDSDHFSLFAVEHARVDTGHELDNGRAQVNMNGILGRRMIVTKRKYFCIAPPGTRMGDRVEHERLSFCEIPALQTSIFSLGNATPMDSWVETDRMKQRLVRFGLSDNADF
jgi:hypothetical protein